MSGTAEMGQELYFTALKGSCNKIIMQLHCKSAMSHKFGCSKHASPILMASEPYVEVLCCWVNAGTASEHPHFFQTGTVPTFPLKCNYHLCL